MNVIKGFCGENATYEFNKENGMLVISGAGAIEDYAFNAYFSKETEKAFIPKIKTVVIENGITAIDFCSFECCANLTSITIPNSVTKIGNYAFGGCISLTDITIPNSITSIGVCVFDSCTNLTNITIPNSVTSIGWGAFYNCTNLTNITIPNSVTNIEYGAFYLCPNLKTKKKAYKAFNLVNNNIYGKYYKYKEGEWTETLEDIELNEKGYHYCNNLFSIFNYYNGEIDKNIAIYECEVGDTVYQYKDESVTNKIKPIKRLYHKDVMRILNEGNK